MHTHVHMVVEHFVAIYTGLPATSIALDEQHLYWVGGTLSCVFAVDLDDPANLLVIINDTASDIFTLSPGQQPLPSRFKFVQM